VAPFAAGLLIAVQMLNWAPFAAAQGAGKPIDIRGFATGQTSHLSALEASGTRAVNNDVAWSGSAVDGGSSGLANAKSNEFDRIFQKADPGKITYARGSGIEPGLATGSKDANQAILAVLAEGDASPSLQKESYLGP